MKRLLIIFFIAFSVSACAMHVPAELERPRQAVIISTASVNHSGIYLARTDSGVVVIDLGWWGADKAINEGLARLGATTSDVIAVFVTHSHRDHMSGWRSVRHAPFYMSEAEVDLFFRRKEHGGWIPKYAEKIKKSDLPGPGDVTVRAFKADTTFVFGSDTLRAFPVPGHTAGSAAYVMHRHLFVGDAVGKSRLGGFRLARSVFSEDTHAARRSLERLRAVTANLPLNTMCTAHLECTEVTDKLWADILDLSKDR